MLGYFLGWLALVGVFLATARALPAVKITSLPWALKAAGVFGLANLLIGGILSFILKLILTIPAFLTFGLAYLIGPVIVNMILLKLTDEFIEEEFEIEAVGALVQFSVILSISNLIIGWIFG
ncbi:phage holin family protein [Myxococcota bacterium]|nr:phage holin family protein [Myxococcota bacterium]MBU1429987.1 phage holin family protein [Myxococcota bacterium]MBU1898729.1 phage holin family protein [Myxococcota bacterium]